MVPKKITSLQHPFVKYIVSLRKEKIFRKNEKKIFIMGIKMVEEISLSTNPLKMLIVQEDMAHSFSFPAEETILVSYEILKKITGVPHPEPVAALVSMPFFQDLSNSSRLLVLDGISDPGNLGTLLRTALALGWDGAYLIETTCDPFNEKALRAAKGATFRLPLQEGSWSDFLELTKKGYFNVLVADIEGSDISKQIAASPLALILSRESQGAREEAKICFQKISIPMEGSMESLNVASAGSILLYGLRSKNGI